MKNNKSKDIENSANRRKLIQAAWATPAISVLSLPMHAVASEAQDLGTNFMLSVDLEFEVACLPAGEDNGPMRFYMIDDVTDPDNPVVITQTQQFISTASPVPDGNSLRVFYTNSGINAASRFIVVNVYENGAGALPNILAFWDCDGATNDPIASSIVNQNQAEFLTMSGVPVTATWDWSFTQPPNIVGNFGNLVFTWTN